MKKLLFSSALITASLCFVSDAKAQLIDESNVTITMDLQPILQLDMSGPQNIDFVFDQISEYVGGITQYGVTTLKVSSTVNWDLYAVGFGNNASSVGPIWDQQAIYGAGADSSAIDSISCNVLELHQYPADSSAANASGGIAVDYSTPFSVVGTSGLGTNSIYASVTPYQRPVASEKYIAGHFSTADFVVGGTYLTQGTTGIGSGGYAPNSGYYYVIDYRIVPGLPAVFPNSAANLTGSTWNGLVGGNPAVNFAQPGLYTMNVKYVLREND